MVRPHILVADSSTFIRTAIASTLKMLDAEVSHAPTGQALLDLLRQHPIDLIILDGNLPDVSSFELCASLREDERTCAIPILLISANNDDPAIQQAFAHGASAFLGKNELTNRLVATTRQLLQRTYMARNRTILVVDDSSLVRKLVSRALIEAGFGVVQACHGIEALRIMAQQTPDLIISDLQMPEMDGIRFCEKVRNHPHFATIPFVVMSTLDDTATMRRLKHLGATSYIAKPVKMEQLVILIEQILSDHVRLLNKERERLETERQMMLGTITGLIEALEARDGYTRGHSEAVATILTGMGRHLGWGEDQLELLNIGGRLHDLGKIGIRDHILLKPGQLTDDEFDIIKQHPEIGLQILGSVPSLEAVAPIVLHHHERFDGRGYPHGLGGEDIPFLARMTAVADMYHALTSIRPYRVELPEETALAMIRDARGHQLCPESVDLFLDWKLGTTAVSDDADSRLVGLSPLLAT